MKMVIRTLLVSMLAWLSNASCADVPKTLTIDEFFKTAEFVAVAEVRQVISISNRVRVGGAQIPNRWIYEIKVIDTFKGEWSGNRVCSNSSFGLGDRIMLVDWRGKGERDKSCADETRYFEAGIGRELFPVRFQLVGLEYQSFAVLRPELFSGKTDFDYVLTEILLDDSGNSVREEKFGYLDLSRVREITQQIDN